MGVFYTNFSITVPGNLLSPEKFNAEFLTAYMRDIAIGMRRNVLFASMPLPRAVASTGRFVIHHRSAGRRHNLPARVGELIADSLGQRNMLLYLTSTGNSLIPGTVCRFSFHLVAADASGSTPIYSTVVVWIACG